MNRFGLLVALLAAGVLGAQTPAFAETCTIGGHNETSENFAPGGWTVTGGTPGVVIGAPSGSHLVFSEVAPRGFGTGAGSDSSEYIEIYNPTTKPVRLGDKYLADEISYFRTVNGPYPAANTTDFVLRFPTALTLNPGRTLVVCVTKAGFAASGASAPAAQFLLEMRDSNGNPADDMTVVTTVSTFPLSGGMLTNPSTTNGEWIVLFCWGGSSDLVCDIDYASWGANSASNPKMNKTGVSIDGPDADALASAYLADSAPAAQTNLGTALVKPNTFQRVGPEVGEASPGGNGCVGRVTPTVIAWLPVAGTQNIRFQTRWSNMDEDAASPPFTGEMRSQDFGVFQPDFGPIGSFNVPPMQPNSFFDVFFEVPLSSLPPAPQKILPGGGPGAPVSFGLSPRGAAALAANCPPDTNWAGNVDIFWTAPGQGGQVNKHYADLLTCVGGPPSYIHFRGSNCATPMPWAIAGVCPGFSVTLVNEDFTPAPNPVPVGWSGWICVSAAAAVPVGTSCCFGITFQCAGATSTIDICSTACDWRPNGPTLSTVNWTDVGNITRFHLRWANASATATTVPASGDMSSQMFGVFLPNAGPIGHFDVPPMQPNSFFDVFFDVPRANLPPDPPTDLPGGGPGPNSPCPPPTAWHGNVDIVWTDAAGGGGQVNRHFGELPVCPGAGPSYIHFFSNCTSPTGMTWSISGLCPGFGATLVNEDKTPAPNPLPPGWTGWICAAAPATTPVGLTCCFAVNFTCGTQTATIDVCANTCNWQRRPPTLAVVDWANVGTNVRFHQRWTNPNGTAPTDPVSGNMHSQELGVFLPNFGPIGTFDVPPIQPDSFFDVFFDVPLSSLPPEPPTQLPGGGPSPGSPCVPPNTWHGNVDIQWSGNGSTGQVNRHFDELLVCPGADPSYVHFFTNCASTTGMSWSIAGLCPGFNATLVNEDKSPAPNPLPPGWSGWICASAPASTPTGRTCCFAVNFACGGQTATIDVCAQTCDWGTSAVTPVPPGMEFGIYLAAPNPTRQGMAVGFALPGAVHATLDVYNIQGQLVRALFDGTGVAGANRVTWDGRAANGRELAHGTYFLSLRSEGRVDNRKVVISR